MYVDSELRNQANDGLRLTSGYLHPVLEERANYRKESANGLYTALPFVLANTVAIIPFLFVCSCLFVLIMYWGIVSGIAVFTGATQSYPYGISCLPRDFIQERAHSSDTLGFFSYPFTWRKVKCSSSPHVCLSSSLLWQSRPS